MKELLIKEKAAITELKAIQEQIRLHRDGFVYVIDASTRWHKRHVECFNAHYARTKCDEWRNDDNGNYTYLYTTNPNEDQVALEMHGPDDNRLFMFKTEDELRQALNS